VGWADRGERDGKDGKAVRVEITGLSKEYGRVRALTDINLTIDKGMFGLLGPNGAGKTTLMRIVTTLLPPTSGSVRVGSYDVTRQPGEVRRLLGYLPQEFGLWRRLTAFEVLDYVASLKGITPDRRRREEVGRVLETVRLTEAAHRVVGSFSGGMRQRLGIAQALLGDPSLLVVDEPTAGLDPEERIRFRNFLSDISGDRVVILSTHIVADVESTCSRLALLRRGELIYVGSPDELRSRARGKVWELQLSEREYQQLQTSHRVVSSRRVPGGVAARVLAGVPPCGGARAVEPDLEDAYMWAMGVTGDA